MENMKHYKTKTNRFSMLIAMLVLSNLSAITLAASRSVLSLNNSGTPICSYFTEIPKSENFKSWRREVLKIVDKYNLAKYLKNWLKDIKTIEEILASSDKKNKNFIELIQQHQVKEVYGSYSQSSLDKSHKLVSIGKMSPGKFVSKNPVIAVTDELYRESIRFHNNRAKEAYSRCLEVAQQELGNQHDITKILSYNPFKDLESSILRIFSVFNIYDDDQKIDDTKKNIKTE